MRIASALIATAASALGAIDNSVPINSNEPGWIAGINQFDIEIEVFIDLLCDDSAKQNVVLKALMNTTWHGAKVSDNVGIQINIFPLPYHVHSYSVAQVVPFLEAKFLEGHGSTEA